MPIRSLTPGRTVEASEMAAAARQTITADDQTIQHQDRPVVLLTVNDAGGGQAVLGSTEKAVADGSVDGQGLTLIVQAVYSGSLRILDGGSSNLTLNGDFYPYNATKVWLQLAWNAVAGTWWEVGRGASGNDNSGLLAAAAGGKDQANTGGYAGSTGGRFNQNTNNYAGSVGGFQNVNSGQNTGSVGGKGGTCRHGGETLAVSWYRAGQGDAQVTNFLLRGDYTTHSYEHTAPVWHELTTPERWTLEADTLVGFRVSIQGALSDGSKRGRWVYDVLMYRDGSNNTTLDAADLINSCGNNGGAVPANWDVQITADDTNEALKIEVHAADDDGEVRWTAHVQAQVCG